MYNRSRVPTVVAALLLAFAFAGCGGATRSSSVASQSGTETTTSPPASASTAGSSASTSDGNAVVNVSSGSTIGTAAYLKAIPPIRQQLARVHVSTAAMAAAIKARDAPTAGRDAMAAAAGVRRALDIARRIR